MLSLLKPPAQTQTGCGSVNTKHAPLTYCIRRYWLTAWNCFHKDDHHVPYDWIITNNAFRHSADYLTTYILQTRRRKWIQHYFRSFFTG